MRLAWQAKGERNFHIFYQLLAGETDEHVRSAWGLRACDQYAYLSQVCVALRCVARAASCRVAVSRSGVCAIAEERDCTACMHACGCCCWIGAMRVGSRGLMFCCTVRLHDAELRERRDRVSWARHWGSARACGVSLSDAGTPLRARQWEG